MTVHTAKQDQIKYFAQSQLGKSDCSMWKLSLNFPAAIIKLEQTNCLATIFLLQRISYGRKSVTES